MVAAVLLGAGMFALLGAGLSAWPLSMLLAVVAFALGVAGAFLLGLAVGR